MPFQKVASDTYRSPSGRKFSGKQVKAYYATGGFRRPPKPKGKIDYYAGLKGEEAGETRPDREAGER